MIIIGIAGKKHSGKDEVCKAIIEIARSKDLTAKRMAFADALKQEVSVATLCSLEYIEEHKENFRLILQGWGTDFRRRLNGEQYWINRWINRVNEANVDVIVTPDVRFINEFQTIKAKNGFLFKVERYSQEFDSHQSETELDSWPCDWTSIIKNDGTITQLYNEVAHKLEMYKILCINQPDVKH